MDTRHLTIRNPSPRDSEAVAVSHDQHSSRPTDEKWKQFAKEDPYTYILTTLKGCDTGEFWRSGEHTIQDEFLPLLQLHGVRPVLALELGCGIGRLVVPLSRHFRELAGVDIAQRMIQFASSYARDNGIKNASYSAITGPEDLLGRAGNYAGRCDFVYSLLVFQHVPDFSVIEGYLHVIRVLLNESGLAYLQFDTRPENLRYRIKTRMPDFLLPRFWRRGIRRIRRAPHEIEMCIRRAGLEIVGELTPHTAYHRYILRLPERPKESR